MKKKPACLESNRLWALTYNGTVMLSTITLLGYNIDSVASVEQELKPNAKIEAVEIEIRILPKKPKGRK